MNPGTVRRIEYLSVIGGFLDGLHVTFGAGLNTIIGARGTGKTIVVECLAYALDTLPSSDHAPQERKRVETLIKRNLNGERIEVGIRAQDGTTYKVTRSFGDDPIVLDADGIAAAVNLKGGLFRTDVYGQNAVESIADRPLFQLDLIDSFASEAIQQIASREKQIVSLLVANAHQIIPLEQEVGAIREELAGLPNVEQKLKGFAGPAGGVTAEVNEAHRLKGLRDRESRSLQRAKDSISQVAQSLRQLQGGLLGRTGALFDAETSRGPNGDLLQEVTRQWQACGGDVDRLLLRAVDRLSALDADLSQQITHLAQRHRQQELAFRATIEKHQQAQQQAAERSALEKQRNHLLARRLRLEELQLRISELRADRMNLLRQLGDVRDERFAVRSQVGGRINTALSPTIRVSISQYGNADHYRGALESQLKGSGVKQALVAQKIATALTPTELADVVRARDTDSLIDRAELSHEQAGKVAVALADQEFLYGLEAIELGDQPLIELKDGEGYKDTSSLSTGQKCTAILPILLLDSDNPLIIDQPEDNLDNRFIFENVVKSLRRVKQQRQLILVTHNPNIPVLGDAEQVVVLDSDGARSRLIKEGSVDGCKDEIVTLLEGGAEAFQKRGNAMASADASPEDRDWPAILEQLETDRQSIPWPDREALFPLDWRPAGSPAPELLSVVELLADDPKWQVRRRAAATLVWLPDPAFSRLTAVFSRDTHAFVRRDADRALDRQRRGEKNALSRSERPGDLAADYTSMERLYGSLPTRKARRIVEKHFDLLVGGTVHNMRGLLTPIKHYADELKDLAKSTSPSRRLLNQHADAIASRLADLEQFLDDMRAYAQPIPSQRRRERLIDLLGEAAEAARRHFASTGHDPARIELRMQVPESLTLEVARHQVLSVFTNLLRNAFEAFRSLDAGIRPFWIAVLATTDGDRVAIVIEDNGVGFGEEDLQQIREFIPGRKTMKHDGTGFGLPTARRYIEGHGGTLDIDSQVQAGTKVRIVLPLEAWGEDAE